MSLELVIEPKDVPPPKPGTRRKPPKTPPKTREFRATLLGYIGANALWPGGGTGDNIRPVYLGLAATEAAMRPFLANLRGGRRAIVQHYDPHPGWGRSPLGHVEVLKSAGYQVLEQRVAGGPEGPVTLATLWLPDVCTLDPGMIDPTGVRFVALTPRWWIAGQADLLATDAAATAAILRHCRALGLLGGARPGGGARWTEAELLALVPQAVHAVAFLERRTSRPLVNEAAFSLQLYLAALESGLFSLAHAVDPGSRKLRRWPGSDDPDPADGWAWARHKAHSGFFADGVAALGLAEPVACHCAHEALDSFLAEQAARYYRAQARVAPIAVAPGAVPQAA
jgi:hypothetical protein